MENMTVAQLRDHIVKVRESCITLSDFVERFVKTSGLNANDVINFPLLFGGQSRMAVQVDGLDLNNDQLRIFNLVAAKLQNAQANPFYLFVSGPGGSGKSLLLKALRNAIRTHFGSDESCLVAAPTVIAAKNVDGGTIVSTFLVKWNNRGESDQFSPQKKTITDRKLKNTKVVLLDAVNFLEASTFVKVDQKLRESLDSQKPFGGASVIVFGDLYQVQPFYGDVIYKDSNAKKLWNLFKMEELSKNENSVEREENDMYEVLRSGGQFLTNSVIDYLKQNCQLIGDSAQDVTVALEKLKKDYPEKRFTVLTLQNDLVNEVSLEVLKTLGNVKDFAPKQCVYNLEGPTDVYSQSPADQASKALSIAIGLQVMLTAPFGNYNHGEIGRVIDVNDDSVTVRFANSQAKITRCGWYSGKKGWMQFPLVSSEAFSIHKSQGMTFDSVILVGKLDERMSKAVYTALSRAKSLKLCQFTHLSTLENLLKRDLEKEKEELKRMRSFC